MHSPLPDSSALEAGIIEDQRPSRLSRVQDNVRHLLRTSVFGSVASSPRTPARDRNMPASPTSPISPTVRYMIRPQPTNPSAIASPVRYEIHPVELLPSPTFSTNTSTTTLSTDYSQHAAEVSIPPSAYRHAVQQMAHQSTMFNTRAVAALDHPDLSDPSLPFFDQQKTNQRHRKCWKRSKSGKRRHAAKKAAGSQGLLCFLAALLLGALVATYLALALTSLHSVTPTFHILFILAILLATIVFAHTVLRLCLMAGKRSAPRAILVDVSRHGTQRRRHHHSHHHHGRHHAPTPLQIPIVSADAQAYVPPTPIEVHVTSDEEAQADPMAAHPSAAAVPSSPPANWDKDVHAIANPPPAYGRWRGSVRADPDLLHWQAVPSPTSPDAPPLPSPTYEEAMAAAETAAGRYESPPSYMTRDSPARQRELRDARAGLARSLVVEQEMVEVRGAAVGRAV